MEIGGGFSARGNHDAQTHPRLLEHRGTVYQSPDAMAKTALRFGPPHADAS